MWASLFAIAVAAAVCLSVVNLASEIDKTLNTRLSVTRPRPSTRGSLNSWSASRGARLIASCSLCLRGMASLS
jgi:hypothetical protein